VKTLTLFLITLILASCKVSPKIDNSPVNLGGITAPAPRDFTSEELGIGRRICSNLKKKREFFETLNNEKEFFKFRAELRNCDNGVYNAELFLASISNANSTQPEYVAPRETYFRDVTTDQNGVMKQVCDAVVASDRVSNTILSTNFKYNINLYVSDEGFDRYEIIQGKKNSAGSYDALSTEAVSIISQPNQAPSKFFGVEKDRVRYTACPGRKFSTIKQIWIEATTGF
jgi:hypothetical protein